MTPELLADALGIKIGRAEKWAAHITEAMERFEINTPLRQAAFLAQIGHESGRLVYVREIWNPPRCAWQERYEGRADLGNTQTGDGERFRGRGLIGMLGLLVNFVFQLRRDRRDAERLRREIGVRNDES